MQKVGTINGAAAASISNYYLSQNIQYILYSCCANSISRNVIVLGVSFTAEMMLCNAEIRTQLP
jgi:hypothetical protein